MLCNVGKVEDVEHFALECEELGCELLGRPRRIVGAWEWMSDMKEMIALT